MTGDAVAVERGGNERAAAPSSICVLEVPDAERPLREHLPAVLHEHRLDDEDEASGMMLDQVRPPRRGGNARGAFVVEAQTWVMPLDSVEGAKDLRPSRLGRGRGFRGIDTPCHGRKRVPRALEQVALAPPLPGQKMIALEA
jgi:hypothetical protein